MSSEPHELPFIDEHAILITAPRNVVWAALRKYVGTSLGVSEGNLLAFVLRTSPRTGFGVSREDPLRELKMSGCHRFSRYSLVFQVSEATDGQTMLKARSYGEFPGPHGRLYRMLVVGTGAHVVATNRILRSVRQLSLEMTGSKN